MNHLPVSSYLSLPFAIMLTSTQGPWPHPPSHLWPPALSLLQSSKFISRQNATSWVSLITYPSVLD